MNFNNHWNDRPFRRGGGGGGGPRGGGGGRIRRSNRGRYHNNWQQHNFPLHQQNYQHQQSTWHYNPYNNFSNPRPHMLHQPILRAPHYPLEDSFLSPPRLKSPPRPPSPLPGSEEYTQRNIQQKSEYIKKQLNLNNEGTCEGAQFTSNFGDFKNGRVQEIVCTMSAKEEPLERKQQIKVQRKQGKYDVQEIYSKIMAHISNLNLGRKTNLINLGSSGYDKALQRIKTKERLELSRALRNICNNQPAADNHPVITSIIPDIGIRIDELPPEVIQQLSTTLDMDIKQEIQDESRTTVQCCSTPGEDGNVDPEMFFKQAEDMLNIPFDDDTDTTDMNDSLGDLGEDFPVFMKSPKQEDMPIDIPDDRTDITDFTSAQSVTEPVITSDMYMRKLEEPEMDVMDGISDVDVKSSKDLNVGSSSSSDNHPQYLIESGRFKQEVSAQEEEICDLLPKDLNCSYLNFGKPSKAEEGFVKQKQDITTVNKRTVEKSLVDCINVTDSKVSDKKCKKPDANNVENQEKPCQDDRSAGHSVEKHQKESVLARFLLHNSNAKIKTKSNTKTTEPIDPVNSEDNIKSPDSRQTVLGKPTNLVANFLQEIEAVNRVNLEKIESRKSTSVKSDVSCFRLDSVEELEEKFGAPLFNPSPNSFNFKSPTSRNSSPKHCRRRLEDVNSNSASDHSKTDPYKQTNELKVVDSAKAFEVEIEKTPKTNVLVVNLDADKTNKASGSSDKHRKSSSRSYLSPDLNRRSHEHSKHWSKHHSSEKKSVSSTANKDDKKHVPVKSKEKEASPKVSSHKSGNSNEVKCEVKKNADDNVKKYSEVLKESKSDSTKQLIGGVSKRTEDDLKKTSDASKDVKSKKRSDSVGKSIENDHKKSSDSSKDGKSGSSDKKAETLLKKINDSPKESKSELSKKLTERKSDTSKRKHDVDTKNDLKKTYEESKSDITKKQIVTPEKRNEENLKKDTDPAKHSKHHSDNRHQSHSNSKSKSHYKSSSEGRRDRDDTKKTEDKYKRSSRHEKSGRSRSEDKSSKERSHSEGHKTPKHSEDVRPVVCTSTSSLSHKMGTKPDEPVSSSKELKAAYVKLEKIPQESFKLYFYRYKSFVDAKKTEESANVVSVVGESRSESILGVEDIAKESNVANEALEIKESGQLVEESLVVQSFPDQKLVTTSNNLDICNEFEKGATKKVTETEAEETTTTTTENINERNDLHQIPSKEAQPNKDTELKSKSDCNNLVDSEPNVDNNITNTENLSEVEEITNHYKVDVNLNLESKTEIEPETQIASQNEDSSLQETNVSEQTKCNDVCELQETEEIKDVVPKLTENEVAIETTAKKVSKLSTKGKRKRGMKKKKSNSKRKVANVVSPNLQNDPTIDDANCSLLEKSEPPTKRRKLSSKNTKKTKAFDLDEEAIPDGNFCDQGISADDSRKEPMRRSRRCAQNQTLLSNVPKEEEIRSVATIAEPSINADNLLTEKTSSNDVSVLENTLVESTINFVRNGEAKPTDALVGKFDLKSNINLVQDVPKRWRSPGEKKFMSDSRSLHGENLEDEAAQSKRKTKVGKKKGKNSNLTNAITQHKQSLKTLSKKNQHNSKSFVSLQTEVVHDNNDINLSVQSKEPCQDCIRLKGKIRRRNMIIKEARKIDQQIYELLTARERLFAELSSDSDQEDAHEHSTTNRLEHAANRGRKKLRTNDGFAQKETEGTENVVELVTNCNVNDEDMLLIKCSSKDSNLESEDFGASDDVCPSSNNQNDCTVTAGLEEIQCNLGLVSNASSNAEETENIVDKNVGEYSIDFEGIIGVVLVIKIINNTVISATDGGRIFCHDLETGKMEDSLDISPVAITSMYIAKTDDDTHAVYVGSLDANLRILKFPQKSITNTINVCERIQCLESCWGYLFLGSDKGILIRYNIKTAKVEFSEKISEYNVLVLKATQEGTRRVLLVATRNSPVCVRDAMSGLHMRNMESPFLPTVYTLLLEQSIVYCGTSQHDILVYTFQDGQLIFRHEATKSKGVVCMQIVGSLLFAGCYNGNVYVYNIKTNVCLGSMTGPGGLLLCMEIIDNKIIVGTKSNKFRAWRIPERFLEQR